MTYLNIDDLMAFTLPDPLSQDYEVPGLGGSVHIQGIVTRDDRKSINEQVEVYRETVANGSVKIQHPKTGREFKADIADVIAACWVAKCVTEPQLTPLQWLQFAGEGYRFLPVLFNQCMICSRENSDEETGLPDGEAAAQKQIEDGKDPLDSGGGSTAKKSSTEHQQK